MLILHDIDRRTVMVAPGSILSVREHRPNHHGVGATVTLVDGQRIEVGETPEEIAARITACLEPATLDAQASPQCCNCGKIGLSTVEGDGGTECQLSDGRWTCSAECYYRATDAQASDDNPLGGDDPPYVIRREGGYAYRDGQPEDDCPEGWCLYVRADLPRPGADAQASLIAAARGRALPPMPEDFIHEWHRTLEWCHENDEEITAQTAWGLVTDAIAALRAEQSQERAASGGGAGQAPLWARNGYDTPQAFRRHNPDRCAECGAHEIEAPCNGEPHGGIVAPCGRLVEAVPPGCSMPTPPPRTPAMTDERGRTERMSARSSLARDIRECGASIAAWQAAGAHMGAQNIATRESVEQQFGPDAAEAWQAIRDAARRFRAIVMGESHE